MRRAGEGFRQCFGEGRIAEDLARRSVLHGVDDVRELDQARPQYLVRQVKAGLAHPCRRKAPVRRTRAETGQLRKYEPPPVGSLRTGPKCGPHLRQYPVLRAHEVLKDVLLSLKLAPRGGTCRRRA